MVPGISRGIIILGIYVCSVMVTVASDTSARRRCHDLIRACLRKFQQFDDNRLCSDLNDAISCLNISDIIMCGFPAADQAPEEETSQSYRDMYKQHEIYQSGESMYTDSKLRKLHQGLTGEPDSRSSQNRHNKPEDGVHSGRAKTVRPDGSSESDKEDESEDPNLDYITTLVEVIEESKEEYKKTCNINNTGNRSRHANSAAETLLLICLLVTLNVMRSISVNFTSN